MFRHVKTDPYKLLGVKPFINCCGTRSVHGGSLILPQVRAAMDAASRQFVNIDELMERARQRIATLTSAEDGLVTAGSAAAIAIRKRYERGRRDRDVWDDGRFKGWK